MQTEFFYGRDKLTVQTASLLAQKKIKGSLHQDVINRINEPAVQGHQMRQHCPFPAQQELHPFPNAIKFF